MSEENQNPDIEAEPAAPEAPKGNEEPKETPEAPSQEKKEVPKEQPKQFSKRERLLHAKDKIEKELDELESSEDDDRPLTVGEFKRMEREKSRDTAVELAESIEDEDERNQVIDLLQNRITPSGDAQKDLELALGAVNSLKNTQIVEEIARKTAPKQHASSPSVPGKVEEAFTPTAEELVFMAPPYNLSKDDIIKARERTEQKG